MPKYTINVELQWDIVKLLNKYLELKNAKENFIPLLTDISMKAIKDYCESIKPEVELTRDERVKVEVKQFENNIIKIINSDE